MKKETLKKANELDYKIENIESFFDLRKNDKSTVTIEVESTEGNMGSNFTRSISFNWGSELGKTIQGILVDHKEQLEKEFEKL